MDDVANCRTEEETKCEEITAGYTTEQQCQKVGWAEQQCQKVGWAEQQCQKVGWAEQEKQSST